MEDSVAPVADTEVAVLAGGCFWGMEDLLRKVEGVLDTEVGYAGGTTPHPTYEALKTGTTGHAEALRVVFDPRTLSFEELLVRWFFRVHDPTTLNRQGNDRGDQYRSAIFCQNEAQLEVALKAKQQVEDSGVWGAPLVTEVALVTEFTEAEPYHQDYLQRFPAGYTCHFLRRF